MNTRSSAWTGRAARDLNEAFGPYARGPIDDGTPRWSRTDRIVVWSSVLGFVALVAMELAGWLP